MPVPSSKLILLVDDSEADASLLLRAFKIAQLATPIETVASGEDAICYLAGEGRFSNRERYPLPALMLLDLKMPGTDGFAVLQWARLRPAFDTLPIAVLTTSDNVEHLKTAYKHGANSFLSKPTLASGMAEMVKSLHDYWILSNRTLNHRGVVQ
jgi:CheY-like chemotaxis protein